MSKSVDFKVEGRTSRGGIRFLLPSKTKQEFEPECNINNILARFKVTGVLVDPSIRSLRQPMFIDCTELPDLATYHERISAAREGFDTLPDPVKEAFGGDSLAALQWFGRATDEQIRGLWRSVGLIEDPNPSKQKASVASVEAAKGGIASPEDDKGDA